MLNQLTFQWPNIYEIRRKWLLKKAPYGPMRDFLSTPFQSSYTSIYDSSVLAVDFETTGLNAKKDKLLSVGFVELDHSQIQLASCYHQIIKTEGDLSADNVVIHQITDDVKAQGLELNTVIEHLLKILAGKVMLVHFSRIEKQFLSKACIDLYGIAPVFPIIDTLVIAKKRLDKKSIAYDPSQLRLSNLREQHHLPTHYAHNALNDAIATAELFLAQVNQFQLGDAEKLKSVLI